MLNATNWFTLRDLDSESSSNVGLSYLSFNISLSVEFWRTWSFLMSALVMLIDFSSGLPGIPHTDPQTDIPYNSLLVQMPLTIILNRLSGI